MLAPILALALLAAPASPPPLTPTTPDIPAHFSAVTPQADYVRREAMVPMRDGVKLFTVIVIPKGAARAPILLSRTPYDAAKATSRNASQRITEILPIADAEFVRDGYIRVYQDVRGRNGSGGDYVMVRPLRGPLNPTAVDESTDAYDTIDWLVKNVPESNGKVGIVGSSYLGFTALMATIDPHPALKAAVPQSPMVDGWIGDDWFHNGAFRQNNWDYLAAQTSAKGDEDEIAMGTVDAYAEYLADGSAGDVARKYGIDALPFARKIMAHPAYDDYWQGQAVDRLLAARPQTVPMLLVVGQWDQEDSYGAPAVFRALQPRDKAGRVSLAIGPWRHSGVNYDGSRLGALEFMGDTALQFRRDVMKPFLDRYLKDKPPTPLTRTPTSLTYETGADRWQENKAWPVGRPVPLYLQPGFGLAFTKPVEGGSAADEYVSDPAKPVPFLPRPIHWSQADVWKPWLVSDQRFVDGRPDVLSYTTPPLLQGVHIAGSPIADLYAATSGSDSDWVIKLIDVYPEEDSAHPGLAGYQLPIGIEIFRGRYRDSFSRPTAVTPGKTEHYRFALPAVNHLFLPGHRIMVQVQSSLFPLYDRNPQTFVPNIFNARPEDYRKATQHVVHTAEWPSAVILPMAGG